MTVSGITVWLEREGGPDVQVTIHPKTGIRFDKSQNIYPQELKFLSELFKVVLAFGHHFRPASE